MIPQQSPRRANSVASLASSFSDVSSSPALHDDDVTARILRRLLAGSKWTPQAFAARLRVPDTAVEMCLASGASSQLLRSAVRQWLRRGRDLPPAGLLSAADSAALLRDADLRDAPHGASIFDQLDDATRLHFEYLQSAIGQNFVSILNDPESKPTTTASSWGGEWSMSWLAQAVAGATAAGSAGGPTAAGGNADFAASVSAAVAFATAEASSTVLTDYCSDVATVYRTHRELVTSMAPTECLLNAVAEAEEDTDDPAAAVAVDEVQRLPLPDSVPLEFTLPSFSSSYVLAAVLGKSGFDNATLAQTPLPAGSSEATLQILRIPDASVSTVTNAAGLLLQQLEQQLAAVSSTLMTAVHARTARFFKASLEFNKLVQETRSALQTAAATRTDIQDGGVAMVTCFLRVARQSRRRQNCTSVLEHLLRLNGILNGLVFIDDAIGSRQFAAAARRLLEVDGELAAMAASGPQRLQPFAALDNAASRITDRRRALHGILLDSMREIVQLSRWDDIDWQQLGDALHAARLLGCFDDVIGVYQFEAVLGAIDAVMQSLFRDRLLDVGSSWAAVRSAALHTIAQSDVEANIHSDAVLRAAIDRCRSLVANAVHLMKPPAFHAALVNALRSLEEFLVLAVGHRDVVADSCVAAALEAEPQVNHAAWARLHLTSVALSMQERAAWFFDARDDESIMAFSPSQVDRLATEVLARVKSIEQLTAQQWVALDGNVGSRDAPGLWTRLRSCLGQQVKTYFKRHHDRSFDRLSMVLTAEKWDPQRAVEKCFIDFTEQLCSSSDADVRGILLAACNVNGRVDEVAKLPEAGAQDREMAADWDAIVDAAGSVPASEDDGRDRAVTAFPGTGASSGAASGATQCDMLFIPGMPEGFIATNSLLILVRTLAEYDWFIRRFPLVAHDAVQRIHDAVKLFDGQCTALVVGGGAVDQGLLEAITPLHYATASQCLHFLAALAPKLQRRLARLVPGKAQAFVRNLERAAKDATEHRNEAFARILDVFRRKIRPATVDPAAWGSTGNQWVVGLLKEAMKFWTKIIKPILGHSSLAERCIVVGIVNILSARIREVAVLVRREEDVATLRNDIRVFKTNVETLLGTGVLHCAALPTVAAAAAASALRPADKEPDGAVVDHLGCGAALDV